MQLVCIRRIRGKGRWGGGLGACLQSAVAQDARLRGQSRCQGLNGLVRIRLLGKAATKAEC